MKTPLPECYGLVGYTEAQMVEYGKAEYERGQQEAHRTAYAMLRQAYDALLISSKPSGLKADQVRIKND